MTTSQRVCRPAAAIATLTLVALSSGLQAATALGEHVTLGGFGTVGGVVTDSDDAQYGRELQRAGADKHPSLAVDSNLGIQLDGRANGWLSGTLQTLTTRRADLGVTTRIEWAYVLVKPVDGLSLRGGHLGAPAFLVSESRQIGYANHWVRPPNEVYGLASINHFNGYDATYRRSVGPAAISVNSAVGKTRFRNHATEATGDRLRALNVQVETEWATVRAGRVTASVTVPAFGVFGDRYTFTGYGLLVDRGNLVAQAEYVQRRGKNSGNFVDADGWYATGGYRFGAVLPYAIVSRTAPKDKTAPVHFGETQHSTAIGVRWDAFKSADIKFQVDRINTHGTSGVSFTPVDAGANGFGGTVAGKVTAFSAAVDFIF